MKNRYLVAAAVIAVGCASASCSAPASRDASPAKPRVALVLKTLNSPFFIEMQTGAKAAADRLGIDLVVQAAEREVDVEKQMQIVENLIQTGIEVRSSPRAARARSSRCWPRPTRASIPIIVLDTRLDAAAAAAASVKTAGFIGSDNYEGGRTAGAELVSISGGKANVALIEGIPGHETGDSRLRGFKDATSPRRASRWWPRRPPTGSATRALPCFRTCCRRIRKSMRSLRATT